MVWIRKQDKLSADLTVAAQTGLRVRKGHVGVEIECESKQPNVFPKLPQVATYWIYHNDGSLRGADNAEYTFLQPLSWEDADKAVDALFKEFSDKKIKLAESVRTSVHVHLNVGAFYQNRLASLLALWYICEEVLSHFSGDHRAGNLFCIRAKDGERVITEAKSWFEHKGEFGLNTDGLHYSALNLAALYKFGSVEVRTMRGLTQAEPVKQWLRILKSLYDASANYPDPRNIIEQFSILGPQEFFNQLFGNDAQEIINAVQPAINVSSSLFEGMRFAQDIAYARDWSGFNPIKSIADPFGRNSKMKRPAPPPPRRLRTVPPGMLGGQAEPAQTLYQGDTIFAGAQWDAAVFNLLAQQQNG